MILEICVDSMASALAAWRGGADRLELCSYLPAGGLTPSFGLMKVCKEKIPLPIHVMIRPREGNFFYSGDEFETMKADVCQAKQLGFEGLAFGLLTENGHPDLPRINELIRLARPMKICFHRAFDVCADPFSALEELIGCGIDMILTSGQRIKAEAGAARIAELNRLAAGRLLIMPGSGINDRNIFSLAASTGLNCFHLSARKIIHNPSLSAQHAIPMGRDDNPGSDLHMADEEMIRKIKSSTTGL